MTEELKDLVVKDLYARIPYGVMVEYSVDAGSVSCVDTRLEADDMREFIDPESDVTIKPYLRPMSSMTEEETKEYRAQCECVLDFDADANYRALHFDSVESIDWLLEHHFDFRDLIPKGAAIEAPEGMYKTN